MHTNPAEKSYPSLIELFGREKAEKRLVFLIKKANQIIKSRSAEKIARVNLRIMREVLLDYIADITRLKDFHEIEKVNSFKVASYTTYWIIKRKPIQLVAEPVGNQHLQDLNEWFGVAIFISLVYDTTRTFSLQDSKSLKKWNDFMDMLHYSFSFRIINAPALELTHQALAISPPYQFLGHR